MKQGIEIGKILHYPKLFTHAYNITYSDDIDALESKEKVEYSLWQTPIFDSTLY